MGNRIMSGKDNRAPSHAGEHEERQTRREVERKLNVHDVPPTRGPQLPARGADKKTNISGDPIHEASVFDIAMSGKSDGSPTGFDVAQVSERRWAKQRHPSVICRQTGDQLADIASGAG